MARDVTLPRWMQGEDQDSPKPVTFAPAEEQRGPGRAKEYVRPEAKYDPDLRPGPARARERQLAPKPPQRAVLQERPVMKHELFGFDDHSAKPTRQLTDAEYKNLSSSQQAAVDFNTMLVAAVQKDLEDARRGKGTMDDKYAAKAGEIFSGAGSPPSAYAPRTLDLLSSIGYRSTDASIDDILGLRTAVTDLDMFALADGAVTGIPEGGSRRGERRDEYQQALARQFDAALESSTQAELRAQRSSLLDQPLLTGFGATPLDEKFHKGFELISRQGSFDHLDEVMPMLQREFSTPELFGQFLQYVDARSLESSLRKKPLGKVPSAKYYDAETLRKLYLGDGKFSVTPPQPTVTLPPAPAARQPAAPVDTRPPVMAEDGSMVPASFYDKPAMVQAEDGSMVPASFYDKTAPGYNAGGG